MENQKSKNAQKAKEVVVAEGNKYIVEQMRAKNKVKREIVVAHAWDVLKRYLNDPEVDKDKKAVIATQLAIKDMSINGRKEIEAGKAKVSMVKTQFIVEAMKRAKSITKQFDRSSIENVALATSELAEEDLADKNSVPIDIISGKVLSGGIQGKEDWIDDKVVEGIVEDDEPIDYVVETEGEQNGDEERTKEEV